MKHWQALHPSRDLPPESDPRPILTEALAVGAASCADQHTLDGLRYQQAWAALLVQDPEAAVRAVVHQLRMTTERELESRRVGEFVMAELRKLDHVGYVRFASVYRSFEDVADFREEIEKLERDLPAGDSQLPLLGGETAEKGKRR